MLASRKNELKVRLVGSRQEDISLVVIMGHTG